MKKKKVFENFFTKYLLKIYTNHVKTVMISKKDILRSQIFLINYNNFYFHSKNYYLVVIFLYLRIFDDILYYFQSKINNIPF